MPQAYFVGIDTGTNSSKGVIMDKWDMYRIFDIAGILMKSIASKGYKVTPGFFDPFGRLYKDIPFFRIAFCIENVLQIHIDEN